MSVTDGRQRDASADAANDPLEKAYCNCLMVTSQLQRHHTSLQWGLGACILHLEGATGTANYLGQGHSSSTFLPPTGGVTPRPAWQAGPACPAVHDSLRTVIIAGSAADLWQEVLQHLCQLAAIG
jgi:hypothetical protein